MKKGHNIRYNAVSLFVIDLFSLSNKRCDIIKLDDGSLDHGFLRCESNVRCHHGVRRMKQRIRRTASCIDKDRRRLHQCQLFFTDDSLCFRQLFLRISNL